MHRAKRAVLVFYSCSIIYQFNKKQYDSYSIINNELSP